MPEHSCVIPLYRIPNLLVNKKSVNQLSQCHYGYLYFSIKLEIILKRLKSQAIFSAKKEFFSTINTSPKLSNGRNQLYSLLWPLNNSAMRFQWADDLRVRKTIIPILTTTFFDCRQSLCLTGQS